MYVQPNLEKQNKDNILPLSLSQVPIYFIKNILFLFYSTVF